MCATANQTRVWTKFQSEITSEELAVFKFAFKNYEGGDYTPIAVSTLVRNRVCYSFFCNVKREYPQEIYVPAIVEICLGDNNIPKISNIIVYER